MIIYLIYIQLYIYMRTGLDYDKNALLIQFLIKNNIDLKKDTKDNKDGDDNKLFELAKKIHDMAIVIKAATATAGDMFATLPVNNGATAAAFTALEAVKTHATAAAPVAAAAP